MALMDWATHVLQWRGQREAIWQHGANPQRSSQFGLFSATREHEGGIVSNRRSACYGEFVSKPCTHRPSHNGSGTCTKSGMCSVCNQAYSFIIWNVLKEHENILCMLSNGNIVQYTWNE